MSQGADPRRLAFEQYLLHLRTAVAAGKACSALVDCGRMRL